MNFSRFFLLQINQQGKAAFAVLLSMLLLSTAFAQPINDDACAPIMLTPTATCSYTQYTNAGATDSPGVPAPGCASYSGGDVWFTVVVPPGGAFTIDTQTGVMTDGGMAIYSGDCNDLRLIECDDDDSPNGLMPSITAAGLTPGNTIWIRVWEYGNNNNGTFGICVTIPPPPPANDDCSGAVALTVNPGIACTAFTSGSTYSALPSTATAPSCGAAGVNDDVWYSFVATNTAHVISLSNVAGSSTDMVMSLYSGTCGALVPMQCSDPNTMTVGGLTVGQTYYIRVWTYPSSSSSNATFDICVATPPPPPANDDCTGAISLTVNPDFNCAVFTSSSTVSATQSTAPAPSCGASGVNDDVWFSFVATNTSHQVSLLNVTGVVTDMVMSIYRGTCGALVHMQCSDPNQMTVTGLTVGTTYYVRVWTYTSTAGSTANFDICVGTPPPPPANDDCAGAIALTVNPDLACAVTTAGTTTSALPTTGVPAPTCGASGVNDDVWFSFVATNTAHAIVLSDVTGSVTDMAMSLYSGSCGTLTHLQCSDPNTMTVGGLTVGQTYYVRVWTYTSTVGSYANFKICVGTPPPPPANDEPCNAITLNLPEDGSCNFQTFTTSSATGSPGVPAPGCASYQGGDVWFKLTVPCTGSVIIDSKTGGMTDGGMAIYSGTCNNLTLIECDDDDSPDGLMPKIYRTGLTPGSTLWIRFWEYGNDNPGTFGICAQVPAPAPPASSCPTAQPFCTSTTPYTVPNITGQPDANGSGAFGCLLTIPNPTYYYLQIQNSGNIDIRISQESTTGTGIDVDFIVWGPFNNLSDACGGISASNIIDCSYSYVAVEEANIPNAVAGQYYLFLVTNYSNQPGTITYQQIGGTGSSQCNLLCNINATNTGPVCAGSAVNLNTTSVPNATYSWTGPNCFTSTQQNPTGVVPPSTPGVYTYTVTALGTNGVSCTDTTRVTVVPRLVLPADTTIKKCAGAAFNLGTVYNTAGFTTNWTLNGAAVANPAAVTTGGTYMLIGTNSNGCKDTAMVTLVLDVVTATVSGAQINCTQSGKITISNPGGISPFTYAINTSPGVFQAGNEFTVQTAGTYTITVKDSLGCTTTGNTTINFVPQFTVNAGPDKSIFSGEDAPIMATASEPVSSVLWSPTTALSSSTSLQTVASPTATTVYTLRATNGLGCQASDDVQVIIVPYCVKVRNAFSPNGDGKNDLWQVYDDYGCLKNISLHVFNRYGNKVFESRDYRNNWDGTYGGKPIPDGTYYAVINFTLFTGRVATVKTDLTIIR